MDIQKIFLVYRPSPDGVRAARYAADLAKTDGRLHVLLPAEPSGEAEVAALLGRVAAWTLLATWKLGWNGIPPREYVHVGDPATFDFGDAIVVDPVLRRRDANVLRPQFETGAFVHGDGPALLPFGDRESGRRAAAVGLPFLSRIGFTEVVFYHTTWRKTGTASDTPEEHMTDGARSLLDDLRTAAAANGLASRAVVEAERVQEVSDGIRGAAVDVGARLVVMARGTTHRGIGYADRVANDFAVPVLMVGRTMGGSR